MVSLMPLYGDSVAKNPSKTVNAQQQLWIKLWASAGMRRMKPLACI